MILVGIAGLPLLSVVYIYREVDRGGVMEEQNGGLMDLSLK